VRFYIHTEILFVGFHFPSIVLISISSYRFLVLSQCFVAKNVVSKGLMSIATKVVVQMNAKLGGEPWTIPVPLKNLMVVGFDVYRGARGTKGGSIGAMVSTTSPTLARYYSTTSVFNTPDELSKTMSADFTSNFHTHFHLICYFQLFCCLI
jgi:hypothetical protein